MSEHEVVATGWKGGLGNSVTCSCGQTLYGRGVGAAMSEHAYHAGTKARPDLSRKPTPQSVIDERKRKTDEAVARMLANSKAR